MNKKLMALLVGAALAAPAMASATEFTGFGVAIDMQFKSTGADGKWSESYVETGGSYVDSESQKIDIGGRQDVIAGVNVWYGFELTSCAILQIGATADLGKTDMWKAKYRWSDEGSYSESGKVKESSHYSVYVAPGYLVTPKTLVYGKLAYHSMKVKGNGGMLGFDYDDFEDGHGKISERYKGWGIGAGISTMLNDNVFVYVEAQRVQYGSEKLYSYSEAGGGWSYNEKATAKPSTTIGSIGIGYNF